MNIPLIDSFLNRITMYRLTTQALVAVWLWGAVLGFLDKLPYSGLDIIITGVLFLWICLAVNWIFDKVWNAHSNVESVYITALILTLITTPGKPLSQLPFIVALSLLAIASKYILAINKKHLFNPAALAVVAGAFLFGRYASWWIGTLSMAPVVLVTGFLIVRKIQRFDLVISFLLTAMVVIIGHSLWAGQNTSLIAKQIIIDSPWMFLAFIMLTEPATMPPTRWLRIAYGAIVGVLFAPFFTIFGIFITPELGLLIGNILSYIVSPKQKLVLALKEKQQIAHNTFNFVFHLTKPLQFTPGQYMEWSLGHTKQDERGMRRYFTIASSPTEQELILGVKFYEKPSTFKQSLAKLEPGQTITAGSLAGDFALPRNQKKKLVFLAGGIGVTPFRSMVKFLTDTRQSRDIVMFYANHNNNDIAYKEIFDHAQTEIDLKVHYVEGRISEDALRKEVPDFADRIFYISGPKSMVDAFETTLNQMGVPKRHIKTDFFPGFA